jgi:hypothetical protein
MSVSNLGGRGRIQQANQNQKMAHMILELEKKIESQ